MEETNIFEIVLGVGGSVLAFLSVYYFTSFNKKQNEILENLNDSNEDSARTDEKFKALKEANEQASIAMKKEMGKLATSMDKLASTTSKLWTKVELQELRLLNVEDQNKIMAREMRKNK